MSKRVVVACGVGVATSHMVAKKIVKLLSENGIDAEVQAVSESELAEALKGAAAFVPVVSMEEKFDVPTIDGSAFLTGVEQEEALAQLLEALG